MSTITPTSRSSEQGLFTLFLIGLAAMLLRALSIAHSTPDPVPPVPVVIDSAGKQDTVLFISPVDSIE